SIAHARKAGRTRPFRSDRARAYSEGAGAGAGASIGSSACGAGVTDGSVGVVGVVCSIGGSTLWVVVPSVSLHAATPNRAMADTEARISFLMIILLQNCFFRVGRPIARTVDREMRRRGI